MSPESITGALAGLKIVDLTRVLGGPYATQIFADHGASVIKVEPPQGDEVRDWGPPFHEDDASYFIGLNRNKRSIGLDLTQETGRDVLFRLLEEADVLIENLKTGTMEKWGLGYEEVLQERFPKLIHCRISGYGADGPLGGFPGYDAIVQAYAGWFSVNGDPDSGPTRVGIPMVDMGTGLYAAIAILMALQERHSSGQGQYVDMTLYDCAVSLMHPHIPNFVLSGKTPELTGNAHPNVCPYDRFRTKTVDIFVGAGNDRAFQRLCGVLGADELAEDDLFATGKKRNENRAALTERLSELMATLDGEDLCARLMQAGVPAGPVLDTEQVMAADHTQHRGMDAQCDWWRGTGTPIKLGRTPGAIKSPPPKFGVHGREVLAEHGFSEDEIEELAAAGVLVEKRR
ncbi:MAG: carnitine dehydratase [Rhodospirillaceae bacterium]|nr:carnitine dehydratase [Rhodospirillaceae bacterium]